MGEVTEGQSESEAGSISISPASCSKSLEICQKYILFLLFGDIEIERFFFVC